MSRPLRIQYPGAIYHVTCRGNGSRRIFLKNDDRYRFIELLVEALQDYQVRLYGYVLMSNHFHMIVQTVRANLSEFMRRFNICYTGWFNRHHSTCGHLYQGRYKAILVDASNYLLELSRYVHLNPVRVEKLNRKTSQERWSYICTYQWSSLPGYMDENKRVMFVDYNMLLEMVGSRDAYKRFVIDGLSEGIDNIYADVQHQMILGDNDFVTYVKGKYAKEGSTREQPMYRGMITEVVEPKIVIDGVSEVFGIDQQRVTERLGDGVVRGVAAELLYRYSGIQQWAIGELLGGIDYSSVSVLRRRLKTKMVNDEVVRDMYKKAEQYIKHSYKE